MWSGQYMICTYPSLRPGSTLQTTTTARDSIRSFCRAWFQAMPIMGFRHWMGMINVRYKFVGEDSDQTFLQGGEAVAFTHQF